MFGLTTIRENVLWVIEMWNRLDVRVRPAQEPKQRQIIDWENRGLRCELLTRTNLNE